MLFDARESIIPYEYPELIKFKEAIEHSYWLVTEFNFTSDIQDYKKGITEVERAVIKKSMLAISQIEVSVKTFWSDLYKRMPKSEIGSVGAVFSSSEVRHMDAYSKLLTILGLQDSFDGLLEVPAIRGRIDYLKKYLDGKRSKDDRIFTKSLILFSLFVEYVSLFSQFYIMMSFNKEKNLFKGISNVVEATSKEEEIHGNFGAHLVKILRKEYPHWFDDQMEDMITSAAKKAFEAESKILDWIFEDGEPDFLSKDLLKNFIKNRFNKSMISVGYNPIFEIDKELIEKTKWFDVELSSTKEGDFFYKRQIDYAKSAKAITGDDLF